MHISSGIINAWELYAEFKEMSTQVDQITKGVFIGHMYMTNTS